jgi:hypothetical protein
MNLLFLYAVNVYIYKVLAVNNMDKFTTRSLRNVIFIRIPHAWVCMVQLQCKVHMEGWNH